MISERIKLLRTSLHKTQKEFSDDLNINQSNISSIEGGRSIPSIEIAEKIVALFPNVNPAWLLTGVGTMFVNGETPEILTPAKVKEIKEAKAVVSNEIANVGIYEKMVDNLRSLLDVANNTNAKLWARLDKAENERDLLFAK